jgi:signal transduction histidine kinase
VSSPTIPAELRSTFLFERLSDDQLDWLAERGRIETYAAGTVVYSEGEPATCFYVLLDGMLRLTKRMQRDDMELVRTDQRGVYAGATRAFVASSDEQTYSATLVAVTDCRFFLLPALDFATVLREWYPMAMHLLEGLFLGVRNADALVAQRERLIALGSLSAGLTHELNNPAAAAVRAASSLRQRVAGMRQKLALLADGSIDPGQLHRLTELQEAAVERAAKAPIRTPLEVSDLEDELAEWLEGQGIGGGWELAAVYATAGLDVGWAEEVTSAVAPEFREGALRWLAYTLETEGLMTEIEDSVTRISTLVAAAKQYSQLDRAPYQTIDVHDGLTSTLVMLRARIGNGVRVVEDYDRSLPRIPAYPAELNQVWTNLIDNAVAAMGGQGTLTLRTRRDGDAVLVEVADTGPGVPEALHSRVFEPFFTTKPVGEGTGLGLDISYRIVVNRHHGDLRVLSAPGDTRFQVRLPLTEARAEAAGSTGGRAPGLASL